MFKKDKRRKTYRYYRRKRRKKVGLRAYLGSKLLEISIVFLTLLILMYTFSFYKKLNQPEAKEQKNLVFVRTQILNGCQKSAGVNHTVHTSGSIGENVAQRLAERLKRLKVNNIMYQIVEIGKLEDSVIRESLILDRLGGQKKGAPSEVALLTAEALGIRQRNVICKKLENNYQGISLTIVIGDDWKILLPST
ncbi:MAG: hypothetical protein KAW02_04380 [candidate division Zixibacteria bacterium]|nr:hypothetical protein [candidate division Zixibacteria bacterium]